MLGPRGACGSGVPEVSSSSAPVKVYRKSRATQVFAVVALAIAMRSWTLEALLSPFNVRATCLTTVFWLHRISAACRVRADEKTARLSRASAYSRRLKSITSWTEMLVINRLDRTPVAMARRRADRPYLPCDGLFSSTVRSRTSGPPSNGERAIIGMGCFVRSVEKGKKKAPRNVVGHVAVR